MVSKKMMWSVALLILVSFAALPEEARRIDRCHGLVQRPFLRR